MIDTVFEAKLNAKKRNKLKDSDFGLPKERKYPLNDEAHVRKAIQFFKYCPPTKRNELALNINKKIKEYKMDISVSKSNPFSRFANKNLVTVTENLYDDEYVEESIRDDISFITHYHIYSCDDIINLESCCKLLIDEALEKCLINDKHMEMIKSVNSHLLKEYAEFLEFNDSSSAMYNMVEYAGRNLINSLNDINAAQNMIPTFASVIEMTNNKYHAYRTCCEVLANANAMSNSEDIESLGITVIINAVEALKTSIERKLNATTKEKESILTEVQSIFDMPRDWAGIPGAEHEFVNEYNCLKNGLYIIYKSFNEFFKNSSYIDVDGIPDTDEELIKNVSFTKNTHTNNLVSEAFTVNEEGDIKISISPKNSFMDSYSSNHKMLVTNWKNKNYDAMKRNIAYVFALISVIERSDGYKNKDPEVMKARAFAINDFKTYLKHLQSVEPEFDFVEYYGASDYDKKIINIPKTTIVGIKKLMRTILL